MFPKSKLYRIISLYSNKSQNKRTEIVRTESIQTGYYYINMRISKSILFIYPPLVPTHQNNKKKHTKQKREHNTLPIYHIYTISPTFLLSVLYAKCIIKYFWLDGWEKSILSWHIVILWSFKIQYCMVFWSHRHFVLFLWFG